MAGQVDPCLAQSVVADVDGEPSALRPGPGHRHGQAARARAQISPEQWRTVTAIAGCEQAQCQVDQQLRFLARDQHTGGHLQLQIAPGAASHQVLQGFLGCPVLLPDGLQLLERGRQRRRAFRAQLQPLQLLPDQPRLHLEQPVEIGGVSTLRQQATAPAQQFGASAALRCVGRGDSDHPSTLGIALATTVARSRTSAGAPPQSRLRAHHTCHFQL